MSDLPTPPRIIMDERERGAIRAAFEQLPCELIITTMDFGDYLISPDMIIERKRGDDLVASLFDSRFFTQLMKIRKAFTYPMLLIEAPELMFKRPFVQESSVYGAIIYACYKMDIPVIPTVDETATASMVYELANKVQNQAGNNPPELNQIAAIDTELGEVTREDQIYFLEGLTDVGATRAELLLNFFGTPYNVIYAINSTQLVLNKNSVPKDIQGILSSIKGLGPKFVEANHSLLKTPFETKIKKSTKKSKKT